MRCGTMTTQTLDVDVKFINRRHHRAGGCVKAPFFKAGRIVQRIDLAYVETVEDPFLDHHLGPAAGFFSGLEDQRYAAREIARFRQIFRRPQQHRCVPVVPAGVHLACVGAGIVQPGFLGDRQRIHVGAQPDGRPLGLTVDNGNDARGGKAFVQLVHAEFAQAFRHESRGLEAVIPQFRDRVQISAPFCHLGGIIRDTVHDGHYWTPVGMLVRLHLTSDTWGLQWPRQEMMR